MAAARGSGPLIPLARVEFREGVNLPGVTPKNNDGTVAMPQYPSADTVVFSSKYNMPKQMISKKQYLLFLDLQVGMVRVEHPISHESEIYPMSIVKQCRELHEGNEA